MTVIRLNRTVSKKHLKLGFSKKGEPSDGRNTGNESKRSRPVKYDKPGGIKSDERRARS
jgi:hypothetical protein